MAECASATTPLQAHAVMIHPEQLASLQTCIQQLCQSNERLLAREDESVKHHRLLSDLVKRTTECDGSSYRPLKTWFQEVEYTFNYSSSNSDLATKTAKGELRKEIETYLTNHASQNPGQTRFEIPWKDLKQHLYNSFIPLDEQEDLRNKVNKLRQSTSETLACYNRRFRSAAEEAYPRQLRNDDQQCILLKAYLSSINNSQIRRQVVYDNPTNLEEAMFRAIQLEQCEKKLDLLNSQPSRVEEPMEVAAVAAPLGESQIAKLIDEKLAAFSSLSVNDRHSKYQSSPSHPSNSCQNHPKKESTYHKPISLDTRWSPCMLRMWKT